MDEETGTLRVKTGLAEMLKGGVIMDVTTADQAKIAEDAGACAVMALERVPADIRREGGVARMADPSKVAENGRLPVVTFTAGGIATPADAALCMQLGADGVFVGSGIFKSGNPSDRAKAIVEATTHFRDAEVLARVSQGLGDAMTGLSAAALAPEELLETRGW